jgi:nucleoside-diphosphate-sugar epimerase
MRVFLAGATGAVGRRLVPRLVERGHVVTGTTRTAGKAAELRALGAEPVVVDGLDAAGIGEAVARAEPDAIIHQMTALAGTPDLRRFDRWFAHTNELRTRGLENLLAAAQATGVPRVVAQSFIGWNNARTGGPVKTEEDPLDPYTGSAGETGMAAIRHLEEAVLRAGGAALRYGSLYGPGATEDMAELVRKRMLPLVGRGQGYTSWVHLDDAASATVLAVEQRVQGVFNVVDDEPAPANLWLPHLAACAGAKPPMRVPAWLARIVAGQVPVAMMTQGRGFSNAKAKKELGWELRYPSWRQGFASELA